MKNEKLTNAIEKIKAALSHAGKIAIIVLAMAIGFIACDVYHRIADVKKDKAPMDLKIVHQLKGTSIAINERSELLIIDRQLGTYEIYQDSIGKVIFNLYASSMYNAVTK